MPARSKASVSLFGVRPPVAAGRSSGGTAQQAARSAYRATTCYVSEPDELWHQALLPRVQSLDKPPTASDPWTPPLSMVCPRCARAVHHRVNLARHYRRLERPELVESLL